MSTTHLRGNTAISLERIMEIEKRFLHLTGYKELCAVQTREAESVALG